mmetsp:Transcript_9832/g.15581  ORF Transcript_9832/g.15581 Transcript_9832/m.15581 type:complete len:115 (+) Transcript_9832:431-775(+)
MTSWGEDWVRTHRFNRREYTRGPSYDRIGEEIIARERGVCILQLHVNALALMDANSMVMSITTDFYLSLDALYSKLWLTGGIRLVIDKIGKARNTLTIQDVPHMGTNEESSCLF